MSLRLPVTAAALGLLSWIWLQDTRPILPSRPATQSAPASRRALPPSRLEGTWQLARIVRPLMGNTNAGNEQRGYLMFTRTHFALHLSEKEPANVYPKLQSSFRQYQVVNDEIVSTSLLGFFNDEDGDVVLEGPGYQERRRFSIQGNTLKIFRSQQAWLELTRVE